MAGAPGQAPLPDPHVFPQVEVLEGKDAGKQGKVVQVIRQRNWVVLEGLNTVSREGRGCSVPSVTVCGAGETEPQGQGCS